jgi:hypothetical protein
VCFRADIQADIVRFLAEGMDAGGEHFGAFSSRRGGCWRQAFQYVFEKMVWMLEASILVHF